MIQIPALPKPNAGIWAKVKHPVRTIKRQFGLLQGPLSWLGKEC
jgi:hypothetical protein